MKNKRKVFIYSWVMLTILMLSSSAGAADNAFSKLGRGAANTLTGWLEVPKNIYLVSSEKNPLLGLTWGLTKGLGLGVVRTTVGVFEVVTFPFPITGSYQPLIYPEYVLEPEGS